MPRKALQKLSVCKIQCGILPVHTPLHVLIWRKKQTYQLLVLCTLVVLLLWLYLIFNCLKSFFWFSPSLPEYDSFCLKFKCFCAIPLAFYGFSQDEFEFLNLSFFLLMYLLYNVQAACKFDFLLSPTRLFSEIDFLSPGIGCLFFIMFTKSISFSSCSYSFITCFIQEVTWAILSLSLIYLLVSFSFHGLFSGACDENWFLVQGALNSPWFPVFVWPQ